MKYRFIFTAQFDRDLKSLRKHNLGLRSDFESFWLLSMYDKVEKENLSRAEARTIGQVVEKIKESAG